MSCHLRTVFPHNSHVLPPIRLIWKSPQVDFQTIFSTTYELFTSYISRKYQQLPTIVSHCQCWVIQGIIKGRLYIVKFTPVEKDGVCLHAPPMVSTPLKSGKVKAREFSGPGSLISTWEGWSRGEQNTAQGPRGPPQATQRCSWHPFSRLLPSVQPQGRLTETAPTWGVQ